MLRFDSVVTDVTFDREEHGILNFRSMSSLVSLALRAIQYRIHFTQSRQWINFTFAIDSTCSFCKIRNEYQIGLENQKNPNPTTFAVKKPRIGSIILHNFRIFCSSYQMTREYKHMRTHINLGSLNSIAKIGSQLRMSFIALLHSNICPMISFYFTIKATGDWSSSSNTEQ